jgi:hypothetical protein
MMAANVAAGTIVPTQSTLSPRSPRYTPSPPPPAPPIQIKIDEAPRAQVARVVKAIPEEEDWEVCPVNPRKRSSQDIDEDEHTLRKQRSGSLSKRLKREGNYIKDIPVDSPTRLRKRSAEELEDDGSADLEAANIEKETVDRLDTEAKIRRHCHLSH